MSLHKARPDAGRPDPTQPGSTILANGRHASPHAMIGDKPILGGLENSIVQGTTRTEAEEKAHNELYHENRQAMKESQAKAFNKKTGEPKTEKVVLKPDPVGDRGGNNNDGAPAEEVKKAVEAEKKVDNVVEKKPDAKPVAPQNPKVEEKPKVEAPVPPVKVEEKK